LLGGIAVTVMGMVGYVPSQLAIAGEWTPAAIAGGLVVIGLLFGVIGGVIGAKG